MKLQTGVWTTILNSYQLMKQLFPQDSLRSTHTFLFCISLVLHSINVFVKVSILSKIGSDESSPKAIHKCAQKLVCVYSKDLEASFGDEIAQVSYFFLLCQDEKQKKNRMSCLCFSPIFYEH